MLHEECILTLPTLQYLRWVYAMGRYSSESFTLLNSNSHRWLFLDLEGIRVVCLFQKAEQHYSHASLMPLTCLNDLL